MDKERTAEEEQTNNETNEKVDAQPSPQVQKEREEQKEPPRDICQTTASPPDTANNSEKRGGSGFFLFFSFLISLTSVFVMVYLFTDSVRIKSQLATAELEADFFNKRSEMMANDISQWKNDVLRNIDGLDKRIVETESLLKNDMKERRDTELTKLLMGINELSRLSDDSARSKIEEAAAILQSLTISDPKTSLLQNIPDTGTEALSSAEPEQAAQTGIIEEDNTSSGEPSGDSVTEEENTEGETALEKDASEPGATEDNTADSTPEI